MHDALSVVWWASALGGASALLTAAVLPRRRQRPALLAAAGLFTLAGILGILSIGIIFLAAAAWCAVVAARATDAAGPTTDAN